MSRLSPAELRAARAALSIPPSGLAFVSRTSPAASLCSVSYMTPQGDMVQRAPRRADQFRAACAHLGVASYTVRRLEFTRDGVTVYPLHGSPETLRNVRADSWLSRLLVRLVSGRRG